MGTFQKLGLDRISQNIAKAVNDPTGTLFVGDITRGDVVTVTFSAADTGSTQVKDRRVGAAPINVDLDAVAEYIWTISDNVLSVTLNAPKTGTISFWVW